MTNFKYFNSTIKTIINAESIAIYGAGTMGRALKRCLSEQPYNLSIECYIVKSMADNDVFVEGLPVMEIAAAQRYKSSLVLLAMNGKYIPEALNDLQKAGFEQLIPISFDGDEWTYIRGNWSNANRMLDECVNYLADVTKPNLHIYVAHSIYDRMLARNPEEKEYEIPIQVGAALSKEKMYPVNDSLGEDHISEKNRKYCEMTGIYWAWKNDTAEYVGFCHYRRKFKLKDRQIQWITEGNADVIVTEPIINYDSVARQYAKDHDASDWCVLIHGISELYPDYVKAADKIQNGIYYYAYNMFIMRRNVFECYCEFVFPVLEYCEKVIGEKADVYQNRYIGFLAERLLSIFIEKNKQYRVAIADKEFVE